MIPIEDLVQRLQKSRKGKGGWKACCPAHDDKNPSLSVSLGDDGRILLHCHAGCDTEAVLKELGLSMRDLMPEGKSGSRPARKTSKSSYASEADAERALLHLFGAGSTIAGRWDYFDQHAALALRVLRIETPRGKSYRPVHQLADGRWALGDPQGQLPLYRLNELQAEGVVLVAEGEKCVDELALLGCCATTSSHGASSARRTDWSPLAGRDVVILPDNDKPGCGYAEDVAKLLSALTPPASVRILTLPDVGVGEDIVDFVRLRSLKGVLNDGVRVEIKALIEGSIQWEPSSAGFAGRGEAPFDDTWPEPLPVIVTEPEVEQLRSEWLPPALSDWLVDISERMQCPLEYPAVGALVAASSLVGVKVGIKPKSVDDWLVVSNLWGAVVGNPASMKSPALAESLTHLRRIEREARIGYPQVRQEYEAQALNWKRRKDRLARNNDPLDDAEFLKLAREAVTAEPTCPPAPRFIVNDSSHEKLGELLRDNPNGLLVFRDELPGLFYSLDKEGREEARSFYLEAWDGRGNYSFDRIQRGTVDVEHLVLSVLGGIQPGPLHAYLVSGAVAGTNDDGLLQRFQVMAWPKPSRKWRRVDRKPDHDARERAWRAFERLHLLTAASANAEVLLSDPSAIPWLRFDEKAQERFFEWQEPLELHCRSESDPPALEAHFGKYRSFIPSLALTDHLIEVGRGHVGIESLERAIALGECFASHARRIYGFAHVSRDQAALELSKRISKGHLASPFTAKQVYDRGWRSLKNAEAVDAAVLRLEDLGWLSVEQRKPSTGRPTQLYHINPRVSKAAGDPTSETSETRGPGTGRRSNATEVQQPSIDDREVIE